MKEKIQQIIEDALAENPTLFLVDLDITSGQKINVLIDGDEGMPISECVRISRLIDNSLEPEHEFAIEVSSPGVDYPLKTPRQFQKNIGRTLKVTTTDNEVITAELDDATEEGILLWWEAREPKPIGKGKHTVEKERELKYNEIKDAVVQIIF